MLNQTVISHFQPITDLKIGIDKVVLGYPLVKGNEKDYAQYFYLKQEIESGVYKCKIKVCKKAGYTASIGQYFDESGKRRILTIVAGIVWGNPYCQFVFNPNRLTGTDWEIIQGILSTCFMHGLKTLLEESHIRKLELNIDFENTPPTMLITIASRIRSGVTDFKGTKYQGKRTSSLSVATYDKATQLSKVEGITLPHALTRVEARLIKPTCTLLDLAEGQVANPWANIFRPLPDVTQNYLQSV